MKLSKNHAIGICLVLASIASLLLVLEFVVFRFLLVASDLPYLSENRGGILKYEANQMGIYRLQNEISAPYRVNADGWNSGHSDYEYKKDSGKRRICIIGDSYVEALQVSHDSSFAELLEKQLTDYGEPAEIYRFGISGAPFSHYLYMLENEVIQYSPDIVIINLVHNDFGESIKQALGSYTSSFSRVSKTSTAGG